MKVTLDTNILISGTFWSGYSFRILELIDKKEIELVLSQEILDEYYRVLDSDEIMDKVSNKNLIRSEITDKIIAECKIIIPKRKISIVNDDFDDNKILECAIEGNVDYILTNDNHLLKIKRFETIEIVTPEEFLKIINI